MARLKHAINEFNAIALYVDKEKAAAAIPIRTMASAPSMQGRRNVNPAARDTSPGLISEPIPASDESWKVSFGSLFEPFFL